MTNRLEFIIRSAQAGDHPALLDLSGRLTTGVAPWRDPAKVATAVRGWITSSLTAAGQDGHDVLVALLGDEVAGLVSLSEREHFTGETDAYIGELAVSTGLEGRGAGRALVAAAEQWAANRALARVTLETGACNYRARHFYERAGYQQEDIRFTKPVGQQP